MNMHSAIFTTSAIAWSIEMNLFRVFQEIIYFDIIRNVLTIKVIIVAVDWWNKFKLCVLAHINTIRAVVWNLNKFYTTIYFKSVKHTMCLHFSNFLNFMLCTLFSRVRKRTAELTPVFFLIYITFVFNIKYEAQPNTTAFLIIKIFLLYIVHIFTLFSMRENKNYDTTLPFTIFVVFT